MIDFYSWTDGLYTFLRTTNQILTAGISITAISLLLFGLTFNFRDRATRSFTLIMSCVVIVFSAEALGSTAISLRDISFWLHLQWIGIICLPPAYLQFSDALLATTGKPSRGRRKWAIRIAYLIAVCALISLPLSTLFGAVVTDQPPAPYLQPTPLTNVFAVYYIGIMIFSWYNFTRAYIRTTTPTSRRRMVYLIFGALAPALGSFPYLLFGSSLAARHAIIFWALSAVNNILVGGMIVIMAYGVAFFGVPWPDRVVKIRLFKWIMRGPVTASITLALTTLVRRTGDEFFGISYSAYVPIVMVISILVFEYLITLFSKIWEKWLFLGKDRHDLDMIRSLEDRLLSQNDLKQFLEMILAAISDRLQAQGAYITSLISGEMELVLRIGNSKLDKEIPADELFQLASKGNALPYLFHWGDDYLIPLLDVDAEGKTIGLLGIIGITGIISSQLEEEQTRALEILVHRATLALKDRRTQHKIYESLQTLTPQVDLIQRMRASGQLDRGNLISNGNQEFSQLNMTQWVKDALGHYWGGPKLTTSPLMQLQVVQNALTDHAGSRSNALRAILKKAIQSVRPDGEQRFTTEWLLYNILDMKFLEGRKVREIALRLAMSEADLYRKQRIAIEAATKAVLEMETKAKNQG
jgi:hypothetical protein